MLITCVCLNVSLVALCTWCCIVHLVFELMFLPVKLYTVKINFFVYCEFICKLSLFKIHFPADVWYRKLVHVLNQL